MDIYVVTIYTIDIQGYDVRSVQENMTHTLHVHQSVQLCTASVSVLCKKDAGWLIFMSASNEPEPVRQN